MRRCTGFDLGVSSYYSMSMAHIICDICTGSCLSREMWQRYSSGTAVQLAALLHWLRQHPRRPSAETQPTCHSLQLAMFTSQACVHAHAATQVCYGFIACRLGTWLVHRTPEECDVLNVSDPILSSAAHPQPTVRGALAWLQGTAANRVLDGKGTVTPPGMAGLAEVTKGHDAGARTSDDDTSQVRDAGGSDSTDSSEEEDAPSHRYANAGHQCVTMPPYLLVV